MIFISVDLPEPDGPINATYSPFEIDRSIFLRAFTFSVPITYFFEIPFNSRRAFDIKWCFENGAAKVSSIWLLKCYFLFLTSTFSFSQVFLKLKSNLFCDEKKGNCGLHFYKMNLTIQINS